MTRRLEVKGIVARREGIRAYFSATARIDVFGLKARSCGDA